jgi:hypothetical protein
MSDFYKEVSNRLYNQFTEKHFQILGHVLAKHFSNYRTELECGLGRLHRHRFSSQRRAELQLHAIIELKHARAKDLRLTETVGASYGKAKMARKSKTTDEISDERKKSSKKNRTAPLSK